MRRTVIGIVLIVAVFVVLKITVLRSEGPRGGGRPAGGDGSPLTVTVVVVASERLADRVSSVGTILPNEEVDIRTETAGRVVSIMFQEGARVAKNDLLLKISDAELRAQFARAQSRLAIARDEANRQKQLFEQTLTSEREYANADNEADAASAEADLIRAQLDKTEIRAPFAGVVGLRSVSEGSYVSPATLITTLRDVSTIKIDFSVPERYAGRLAPGDAVEFRIQGSRQTYAATVYALEAGIDEATRTLRVRARAPNRDGTLVPGAFADVVVPLAERETITVPAYAVIPQLKGHSVFVYANGSAETKSIDIGTRTDERVEVLAGLQPGDTVITSALLQLKPGTPVRLSAVN
ncbi:MAG TPA: efflux RND transporter periplasmic adaptor subunit [Candidatus Krumholzibacteria bacterium]|nr:efflux RND transporter periplasmic adaptor subunit [Candidatus Krumholzibacteria bacterium]